MINFKLAELRKKNNLTQQQLGDILGVSYQTISKWENNVAYPDISVLPQISSYFGVSVDALLGLVPLEQGYKPSDSGQVEYWERRLQYLQRTRKTLWNEDYMKFLIRDVWKIDRPITVLDCGCGFGALGLMIMPMLPPGSKYVGVDFSRNMIEAARATFEHTDIDTKFILNDILEYKASEKYDMVISQAVLRHVDNGEKFLYKMAEHVKAGGLFVSIECNREFEADGLYIQGMDYLKLCQHDGMKKLWKTELDQQKKDYSIAMKIPHYMKAAGLKNVDCRLNDRVTFLEPEQPDYEEMLESTMALNCWVEEKSDKEIEETVKYCMNHGMSRKEAEDYCRQQNSIPKYLKQRKGEVALTKTSCLMISYGWK